MDKRRRRPGAPEGPPTFCSTAKGEPRSRFREVVDENLSLVEMAISAAGHQMPLSGTLFQFCLSVLAKAKGSGPLVDFPLVSMPHVAPSGLSLGLQFFDFDLEDDEDANNA